MKTYLRQFAEFVLFSQLFLAAGAAAQTAFTYFLLGEPINLYVVALVFFSTLAMYNLSMVLANRNKKNTSILKRVQWMRNHQHLCSYFTLMGALSTLCLSFFLSLSAQFALLALALVSIAYSLPLIRYKGEKISLRNVPGLKLLVIAMVWALSTTLLPIMQLNSSLSTQTFALLLIHRILFFMAIAIPFDVRDVYQDSVYSLKTIAVALGKSKSKGIAHLALLASSVAWWTLEGFANSSILSIVMVNTVGSWCIQTADSKKELFYFLVLDGLLFLAPLLFFLQTLS